MYLVVGADANVAWNYLDLVLGTIPSDYGTSRMRYKKTGNHVFNAGSVNVTPGFNIVLCTIPEGYRPKPALQPSSTLVRAAFLLVSLSMIPVNSSLNR